MQSKRDDIYEAESGKLLGDLIMGVLRIPKIQVHLPVYHGTSAKVLEEGVGHLYGSSLTQEEKELTQFFYRGLPSKTLFTDLDQIKEGDLFFLDILGEEMAYRVEAILTVEPEETDALEIIPGKDYVTLVTCNVQMESNSHRLLVIG